MCPVTVIITYIKCHECVNCQQGRNHDLWLQLLYDDKTLLLSMTCVCARHRVCARRRVCARHRVCARQRVCVHVNVCV